MNLNLINESKVKIKFMRQKIFCEENYKVVIIMRFLLHQNIFFFSKCSWSMFY